MISVVALALLGTAACRSGEPEPETRAPDGSRYDPRAPRHNLVIILSDSLRAANLPLYGYGRPTSPNLVKLAKESRVFDHHLANYPSTRFSVSQLHTQGSGKVAKTERLRVNSVGAGAAGRFVA
jgi:glucan phosphoethanolaminetransferase (alkaline phosphatase superfamily)